MIAATVWLTPWGMSENDNASLQPVLAAQATSTKSASSISTNATNQTHSKPQPTKLPQQPKPAVVAVGTTGDAALWMNEALAEFNLLPLTFKPANGESPLAVCKALQASLAAGTLIPVAGSWTWKTPQPQSLVQLWNPNVASPVTESGIMAFEAAQGLAVDGIAGPQVYAAFKQTLTSNQTVGSRPYTYITVSETRPETLRVWQNGNVVLTTLANTGISASPTPIGTFPVYAQYLSQDMQGKDPNGVPYNDPDVPYVSYFDGGCAIHGFVRASYGFPQSLGCVELPLAIAGKVFSYIRIGTLVTIQS
ncbi:L,D-transpeptidase family protein [Alicyclobacillus sacchari]|uniref:L,D-transpeptidase family protein n=1 Tax=Alicyclobacillus sacchari TaxID=392010 RepID=UPI001FB892B7|nr:L,D-transpeptidase family protein [Alicyclobacillus sacchari]